MLLVLTGVLFVLRYVCLGWGERERCVGGERERERDSCEFGQFQLVTKLLS